MRSEAQKKAEKRIQSLTTRIAVRFRTDRPQDVDLLDFLRSQVADDKEIPAYIKGLIEREMDR
jgi:hypothetical protein